jgi:hypothetical protein
LAIQPHLYAPFVPRVAVLLNIAWHSKDADDLAAIVDVERCSCEGAGGKDGNEDAFVH